MSQLVFICFIRTAIPRPFFTEEHVGGYFFAPFLPRLHRINKTFTKGKTVDTKGRVFMRQITKAAAIFTMAFAAGILCAVFLPSQWLIGLSALTVIATGILVLRD